MNWTDIRDLMHALGRWEHSGALVTHGGETRLYYEAEWCAPEYTLLLNGAALINLDAELVLADGFNACQMAHDVLEVIR